MDSEKVILGLAIAIRVVLDLVGLQGQWVLLDRMNALLFFCIAMYEFFHRGVGWISIFLIAISAYYFVKSLSLFSSNSINRESDKPN